MEESNQKVIMDTKAIKAMLQPPTPLLRRVLRCIQESIELNMPTNAAKSTTTAKAMMHEMNIAVRMLSMIRRVCPLLCVDCSSR